MALVVGIAGGTASGKTTVARKVHEALETSGVSFIDQDSYYRDLGHLTPEEQRAAAAARKDRVAEKRAAGKSLRQIAEEECVSEVQIRRDVECSGAPPGAPEHSSPATQEAPEVIVNLPQPPPYLAEVIALAKAGKTRFEIAEAIGKKPEAVRVYLIRARQAGYLPSPPGGRTPGADGKTYPAGRRPATTGKGTSPAPSANGTRHDESQLGIGMTVANKVKTLLRTIPRDDPSRAKGLREVLRWIHDNK